MRHNARAAWPLAAAIIALLALPTAARALPQAKATKMVDAARSLLGVPYEFGGRLRRSGEGIDCQGVLFYAAERLTNCGWKSFSVFPSRSVPDGELGDAVDGMAPVASAALAIEQLAAGDIILLVGYDENPAEAAIGNLGGRRVWVWHTGIYSGAGNWIVGDHYAGRVIETPLKAYLSDHRDAYVGLLVTRMQTGPQPKRCRHNRPMRRPR